MILLYGNGISKDLDTGIAQWSRTIYVADFT